MIVAIGVDVDDTFATFVKNALDAGTEPLCVNLRVAVDGAWRFDLPAKAPARLLYAGEEISLSPDDAYYCRLIDLSSGAEPFVVKRWQGLMTALRAWLEAAPGRVVNRPSGGLHNSSKPLHEAVLRGLGLSVPESITSSNPETLRAFAREGPTISKAVCGVRGRYHYGHGGGFGHVRRRRGPCASATLRSRRRRANPCGRSAGSRAARRGWRR
jgi:hypothetical protein